MVASLRHGNSFPLVNKAILDRAKIIGRKVYTSHVEDNEFAPRRVSVHVTFLLPSVLEGLHPKRVLLSRVLAVAELVFLVGIAVICFQVGLTTGGLLLLCLVANLVIFAILQQTASFVFANKAALAQDIKRTASAGAALDAHVIAQDWSASDMDVVVGYSSQIHALTNIAMRIKGWTSLIVLSRISSLVLIAQAALLASLLGCKTKQAWGSAIWQLCYLGMHLVSSQVSNRNLDMVLDGQCTRAIRLPPTVFLSRKAALAFVGTLPGIERRFDVSEWDWMDSFIPNNERRREWIAGFEARLGDRLHDRERGGASSDDVEKLVSAVVAAREDPAFRSSMEEFLKEVGLPGTMACLGFKREAAVTVSSS